MAFAPYASQHPYETWIVPSRHGADFGAAGDDVLGDLATLLVEHVARLRRLLDEHESFWTAVYPLFMDREITRANVREVVRRGLEEARGNYKIVARLFNMEARDYKRFLNFLRKHDCQIPFKEYR